MVEGQSSLASLRESQKTPKTTLPRTHLFYERSSATGMITPTTRETDNLNPGEIEDLKSDPAIIIVKVVSSRRSLSTELYPKLHRPLVRNK